MPINETRTEIQINSQTIKQSQLLVKISQSNHQIGYMAGCGKMVTAIWS